MKRLNAPVLARMLDDCAPRLVIVAGIAGLNVFRYAAPANLQTGAELSRGGDARGTYPWRALEATLGGRPFVLAQIPHLSRAGSKHRLKECSEWLMTLVALSP